MDDVVDAYEAALDHSLIDRSLARSVEERLEVLMQLQAFAERRAGHAAGV